MGIYSEAEIQVLIAVLELARENKPADPENLAGIAYFRRYREDWGDALADLANRGFLVREGAAYALTGRGAEAAERLREARPPIYFWYTEYYAARAPAQPMRSSASASLAAISPSTAFPTWPRWTG